HYLRRACRTGQQFLTLRGHGGNVTALAFSPDGTRLLSGGTPGGGGPARGHADNVKVWDVNTLRELRTLPGHRGTVLHVASSADGKRFLSAAEDGTATVWEAATG